MAYEVLSALRTLNPKLDLCWRALKSLDQDLAKKFQEIMPEIRTCYRLRSTVLHATWTIFDDKPDDVIEFTSDFSLKLWTLKDFETISNRIGKLNSHSIGDFYGEMWKTLLREQKKSRDRKEQP